MSKGLLTVPTTCPNCRTIVNFTRSRLTKDVWPCPCRAKIDPEFRRAKLAEIEVNEVWLRPEFNKSQPARLCEENLGVDMATIEGTLHLDILPDKGVRLVFSPHTKGTNSRPLGIPNTGQTLSDLEAFWGFSPSKAKAAVAQLEKDGHIQLSVIVDEEAVTPLFS